MIKNKSDYKKEYEQKYANKKKYPTYEALDDKLFRVEKTREAIGNSPFMGEMTLLLSILVLGITVIFNFINLKFRVGAYEGAEKVLEDNTIIASCSLFVLIIILVLMLLRYAERFIDFRFRLPEVGIREIEIDCIKEEIKKREQGEGMSEKNATDEEKIYIVEKKIRENDRVIKAKEDGRASAKDISAIAISAILGFSLSSVFQIDRSGDILAQFIIFLCIITVLTLIVALFSDFLMNIICDFVDKKKIGALINENEQLYREKIEIERQIRDNVEND